VGPAKRTAYFIMVMAKDGARNFFYPGLLNKYINIF
jgi:hypothetical protein